MCYKALVDVHVAFHCDFGPLSRLIGAGSTKSPTEMYTSGLNNPPVFTKSFIEIPSCVGHHRFVLQTIWASISVSGLESRCTLHESDNHDRLWIDLCEVNLFHYSYLMNYMMKILVYRADDEYPCGKLKLIRLERTSECLSRVGAS